MPEEQTINTIPPKVAAAIIGVMGEIPKLERKGENTHGRYNFASIDEFLEATRPLCAKHGLLILQDEESFETRETKGKDQQGRDKSTFWLLMKYRFTLAHSSGETWDHHPTRTIMVNAAMGSQAFGAAQSYVLKQYMRSLFQIATGEKGQDIDGLEDSKKPGFWQDPKRPTRDLPGGVKATTSPPLYFTDRFGEPDPEPLDEGTFVKAIIRELEACEVYAAVGGLMEFNADPLAEVSAGHQEEISKVYDARCKALRRELREEKEDEAS